MKNYSEKFTTALVLLIYIISLIPAVSIAADDNLLYGGDFESDDSASFFSGGIVDHSAAFEGEYGMQVINPYGQVSSSVSGHILEYTSPISLKEGRFYTFEAYVVNPLSDNLSSPEASAYLAKNNSNLYIDISNVGFDWAYVSASFMATEDTVCNPIITLSGGDEDFGFFIDSISIKPENRTPKYAVLNGPDSVFIPQNGFSSYRYNIVAYDMLNEPINILIDDLDITIDSLPEGVTFDSDTGMLYVHSTAEVNKTFSLTCNASAGVPLQSFVKTITTTKNILQSSSFDENEGYWVADGDMDYTDGTLSLFASSDGSFGKYTALSYTEQLFLQEGMMYVFRANVASDEEFPSSSVYISNLSFASSGYAEINITGIGGDWREVTSAFLIEDTGLYDLTINLYAPSERPIYIDNVYLGIEDVAPTAISIHVPGNIMVSSDTTTLPSFARVLDQLGRVMEDCIPEVSISPSDEGVYLSDNQIFVKPSAHRGDYVITATYEDISSSITISVSDDMVGDGSFEVKQANEWWTASDGATFSIVDYDGSKAGHVYSPEGSCLVLNNSYMKILKGQYYVFNISTDLSSGTITAFIDDLYTDEYIPFAQFKAGGKTIVPFSLDTTALGRLVLYIESDNSVGMILDDVSINLAELSVQEVSITGGEYGDFLRGSYVYTNNMTEEADADVSATRWYISSSLEGRFEPIGIPNQNYLEFTEDMVGQYVVFEVTPICGYTGLSSDPVRSLPVLVAEEVIDDKVNNRPLSEMTPIELDSVKEHPFSDISSHWAEGMISSLCASGIVSGREATKFYPDASVTRAEFTAMVARAFSLVSLPYSGQFEDVSENAWYSGWVEACYRRGIIQGVTATEFDPNARITREQMATILMRAYLLAKGPLPYDLDLRYYDSFLISSWAYDSVKMATNLNLFTGDDMNLFKPSDYAARGEAAACLYRALKCFY